MPVRTDDSVDEVFALLRQAGARRYGGERVSQLAHALQCASLAEQEGAATGLVAAALLHDIGHLLGEGDEGLAERGIDAGHEAVGATYLAGRFDAEVAGPVRLHVDAKRYLCQSEPDYFDTLSPASVRSLAVQGGPFDAAQAAAFIAGPHGEAAVWLRRWDEQAKDPAAVTPGLEHFRRHLDAHRR